MFMGNKIILSFQMMIPDYTEPLFRPPAEAESLIFQVALGCPRNSCAFCGMYKGRPYRERSLSVLAGEIQRAAVSCPETKRIFLADGDVLFRETAFLEALLTRLNRVFP